MCFQFNTKALSHSTKDESLTWSEIQIQSIEFKKAVDFDFFWQKVQF